MSVRGLRPVAPWLVLAVLLAGCASDVATPAATVPDAASASRPTVVALIDSGINPYHVAFRATPESDAARAQLPGATPVRLSEEGDYDARLAEDHAFWSAAQPYRLYAFEGTRVLAISMREDTDLLLRDEEFRHGTGTASMVAREDPDALLVMIQVSGHYCFLQGRTDCFGDASNARAMQWAADQPWIDVISVSMASHGNPPAVERAFGEERAFFEAAKLAHARGKVVVNSAGNSGVTPTVGYTRTGPPWIITVGGAEGAPKGDNVDSSRMMDVAANYTEYVADATSVDGMEWTEGTSYSAPIVAGVLSRALHDVRARLGDDAGARGPGVLASGTLPDGRRLDVGSRELRDALNASAALVTATDWEPLRPKSNESGSWVLTHVPVLAPGPQFGWGYVDGTTTGAVVTRVLSQDVTPPDEKAAVAAYMAAWQRARESYWSGAG